MVGKFGSNHAIISQNLRVMCIQPSRETKLLAKREREEKRKKTIYIAILVLKNGKENTMETFLQTIKGGGERLRMGLVFQDKYRIYNIVRALLGGS